MTLNPSSEEATVVRACKIQAIFMKVQQAYRLAGRHVPDTILEL